MVLLNPLWLFFQRTGIIYAPSVVTASDLLLPSSGQKLGMLLTTVLHSPPPPLQRITWPRLNWTELNLNGAVPGGLEVKNPPANAGDSGDKDSTHGSLRYSGQWLGNPFWYSCLENPMDRGAWWATVHGGGSQRVGHDWVTKWHQHNSAEGETLCSVLISHKIHPLFFFKPQLRSHSSPAQQHNPSLIFLMITIPFTQMNTYSLIQLLLLYSLFSPYWIVFFFLSFFYWPHLQLVGSQFPN